MDTNSEMQAFHNDPSFKARLIDMARQHREADDYIAGTYADEDAEKFRGCSVGCTVRDINYLKGKEGNYDDHVFLADQLGVPEFVVRLQDRIFEGLPDAQRSGWTERLLTAIPVGADLTPVLPRFLLVVQRRNLDRLDQKACPRVYAAILEVVDMLEKWVDTGAPDVSTARSVESSWSAAAESARWAAQSAVESVWAAQLAAQSAESSRWLAWSAESAAESAEEQSEAYSRMADDLVRLVQEAK